MRQQVATRHQRARMWQPWQHCHAITRRMLLQGTPLIHHFSILYLGLGIVNLPVGMSVRNTVKKTRFVRRLAMVKKKMTSVIATRKKPNVAKKAGSERPRTGFWGSGEYSIDAPELGFIAVP